MSLDSLNSKKILINAEEVAKKISDELFSCHCSDVNLTDEKLGDELDCSRDVIYKIRTNQSQPKLKFLLELANYKKKSLTELLTDEHTTFSKYNIDEVFENIKTLFYATSEAFADGKRGTYRTYLKKDSSYYKNNLTLTYFLELQAFHDCTIEDMLSGKVTPVGRKRRTPRPKKGSQ